MTNGSGCPRLTFATLVVTSALSLMAHAQQTEDAVERAFEAAMRRAAPEFRPEPARRSGRGQESVYKEWTSDGRTVSARYFVSESADSAAQLLRSRSDVLPIPFRSVEGYGDQALLLARSNPNGERRLWFRKGTIVVEVTAGGEDAVRRFATVFADAIER